MGTHRVAYVDADAAAAGNHTEGEAAAAGTLGAFNYVDIKPTDVAVLDYISKQAKKQTNLQYAAKVREQAVIALRRKAAQIVTAALAASELNTAIADAQLNAADAPRLQAVANLVVELLGVFGIDLESGKEDSGYPAETVALAAEQAGYAGSDPAEAVQALLDARAAARKERNFAVADAIRDGLKALGLVIEDTPQGARISMAG
jgi:cysteinyl-tRNA synthetase